MPRNLTITEAADRLGLRPCDVLQLCRKAYITTTRYAYDLGDGYAQDLTEAQVEILERCHFREIARLRRANERREIRLTQLRFDL